MILFVILVALAIIVSLSLLGIANGLFSMFIPDRDAEALNNFGALNSAIKTLMESQSHYIFIRTPMKLNGKYCIAAFDKDFSHGEISPALKEAYEPSQCFRKACLCLFKNPNWGSPSSVQKSVLKCYPYDEDIVFYSQDLKGHRIIAGTNKEVDGKQYENFVVFGWNNHGYKAFGLKDLWIEKRAAVDKVYIYIAEYDKDNVKNRINSMKK